MHDYSRTFRFSAITGSGLGKIFTVEPVFDGTVLSGHPLISSHVTESPKFLDINRITTVIILNGYLY